MKVTQEKLPASQIGLQIEIPSEKSKQVYEQVIKEITRSANIPGFRKGKVPRAILLQRFGTTNIKASVVEKIIQTSLEEAVKQENIEAIGQFDLISAFDELVQKFDTDSTLVFSAKVDVRPEIELGEYKGLSFKAEEQPYDSTKVDNFLEDRRKQKATLIPVEGRPAVMGDVAVVDYQGRFVKSGEGENQEFEDIPGGKAENFEIELSSGRFIEGLIEGVVGMNPGENKEISLQFPTDYAREDFAGKTAIFTMSLKELKEKELPELNDDFAQEISDKQNLAELRESLESKYKDDAEQQTTQNKEQELLKELVKVVGGEIPETMIKQELESMLNQTAMQLSNAGIDVDKLFTAEMVEEMKQRSRPEAIDRIKQNLALKEIAQREAIEADQEEVKKRMEEIKMQLGDRNIDQSRLKQFVEFEVKKERTITWLLEHSQIELVPPGTLNKPEEEEETELSATDSDAEITQAETPDQSENS